ncbi:MAG: ParB/RepB/Spo0J family partition protein [Bacteroidales bacterium]|nr:ParB/RepB/Spo0J family partition protein [Bacteroidales bacterium]
MNAPQQKKALGRGLSALISASAPSEEVVAQDSPSRIETGKISHVKIEAIEANPWQPRTEFESISLQELSESIQAHGLIQPITVRNIENGKYQLISGERRLRASIKAGLTELPAYIRTVNDQQMIEMALVENIQREDLNSMEVALSYQRLIDECQLTQDQLSEKVGKNRSTITNFLRLLKLPSSVQLAVRDKKISMGHAKIIAGLPDVSKQEDLCKKVIQSELSVRSTESLAKKLNDDEALKTKAKIGLPASFETSKKELSKTLDTKIEIKRNLKGKGSIQINFKNDDDFKRIFAIINK